MSADIRAYLSTFDYGKNEWKAIPFYYISDYDHEYHLLPVIQEGGELVDWARSKANLNRGLSKWMPDEIVSIVNPDNDDKEWTSTPEIRWCSLAALKNEYAALPDTVSDYDEVEERYKEVPNETKEAVKRLLDATKVFARADYSFGTDDDYRLILEIAW